MTVDPARADNRGPAHNARLLRHAGPGIFHGRESRETGARTKGSGVAARPARTWAPAAVCARLDFPEKGSAAWDGGLKGARSLGEDRFFSAGRVGVLGKMLERF